MAQNRKETCGMALVGKRRDRSSSSPFFPATVPFPFASRINFRWGRWQHSNCSPYISCQLASSGEAPPSPQCCKEVGRAAEVAWCRERVLFDLISHSDWRRQMWQGVSLSLLFRGYAKPCLPVFGSSWSCQVGTRVGTT